MAGYFGYSKSNNALAAEAEGRFPLSHAIAKVAQAAGCTRAQARESLLAIGPAEWHHTSKKFNRTDYYDVAAATRHVRALPALARLVASGFEKRISDRVRDNDLDARIAERQAIVEELAREADTTAEIVMAAYYNDWSAE
jgi:hypothetical protein